MLFFQVFFQSQHPTSQPPKLPPRRTRVRLKPASTMQSTPIVERDTELAPHALLAALLTPDSPCSHTLAPLHKRDREQVEWQGGAKNGVKRRGRGRAVLESAHGH